MSASVLRRLRARRRPAPLDEEPLRAALGAALRRRWTDGALSGVLDAAATYDVQLDRVVIRWNGTRYELVELDVVDDDGRPFKFTLPADGDRNVQVGRRDGRRTAPPGHSTAGQLAASARANLWRSVTFGLWTIPDELVFTAAELAARPDRADADRDLASAALALTVAICEDERRTLGLRRLRVSGARNLLDSGDVEIAVRGLLRSPRRALAQQRIARRMRDAGLFTALRHHTVSCTAAGVHVR